jgi:hypothetical protein
MAAKMDWSLSTLTVTAYAMVKTRQNFGGTKYTALRLRGGIADRQNATTLAHAWPRIGLEASFDRASCSFS